MRTYGSRGWVVNYSQPGVCPLGHISSQSINKLLEYGAGGNCDHYVQLAKDVLQMNTFETEDSLTDLIHSIMPTAPLQLQGPAYAQEEWDCSAHLHYLQSILRLSNRVEVLAHHHIGNYIGALAPNASQRLDAIVQICNTAERLQVDEYHAMLNNCNCTECCAELQWLQNPRRLNTRPMPCKLVQVQCKLNSKAVINITPPFFRQCIAFSSSVPARSPALLCTSHTGAMARLMFPDLASMVNTIERRGSLPCSPTSLGLTCVFRVPMEDAIEIVHYTDGDDGYLQVGSVIEL